MSDWRLRLRSVLDGRFAVVVVVLLAVAVASGWVAYTTYDTPATTVEERVDATWETAAWFNHSATVTEPNPVYPVGTRLVDRPVYVVAASPWLNGTYAFTHEASDGGELNGTVSLTFVLRAVEDQREGRTVVWRTERPLGSHSFESVASGETVRVPFAVNVNDTVARTKRIDGTFGNTPGRPEFAIRATIDLTGTVNGDPVDREVTSALPVALDRGTFRPNASWRWTDRRVERTAVTVERPRGPMQTTGVPTLFLVSVVALGALMTARQTDRLGLSEAERARLEYLDDRAEYDEWISTITLPPEAFDYPEAEAASLEGLVDFAIDTDSAVVEDPAAETYHVVHDGILFTYRAPPASPAAETPVDDDDGA